MLSALMMFARVARALRYAAREEAFLTALGAGLTLVIVGTLSYAWARAGTSWTRSTSPWRR